MYKWIEEIIQDKLEILNKLSSCGYLEKVEMAGCEIVKAYRNGNKVLIAGNGGSAADAQHFAGEMVGRFTMERIALSAISLTVDPSVMTCIANDYGYAGVFARQISGIGNQGDIFIAISTSGNSENCIRGIDKAHEKGMKVVGLLGKDGGVMKEMCDYPLVVPSNSTPRIQEIHTLTIHILCEIVERELFGDDVEESIHRESE